LHAHNIHFSTYSNNKDSLVLPQVILAERKFTQPFSKNQEVLLGKILFIRQQRPLIRQQALQLGISPNQVPTTGKDNHKGPDFLVPIPYVPEDEKEEDTSAGKPPSVKLLLDSEGKKIDNPTVQVQPIFNGGTTDTFSSGFRA
jgi:hypothetical protein